MSSLPDQRARSLAIATRCALLSAMVCIAVLATGPAGALSTYTQPSDVRFAASLDGQRLDLSSSGDPIVLDPDKPSTLAMVMTNTTGGPLTVRQVQIRGSAFGITLLAYDVTINAKMAPGERTRVNVPVEFVDLGQQANGLLPATIRLIGADGAELGSRDFTIDVRGSATSLTAMFALIVAIATGASIAIIWIAVGRRRLPPSRWQRGLRFALVGLGAGVTLTLFLSLLLLVTPSGSVWIPLVAVPTAGAFLLGWFSPGPLSDEEVEVEDWMRETVARDD